MVDLASIYSNKRKHWMWDMRTGAVYQNKLDKRRTKGARVVKINADIFAKTCTLIFITERH